MPNYEEQDRRRLHILSLGAGVQSSTMALMAAAGEITPMPDAAIFADTQVEPSAVYEWLGWLEKQLPFPVHRVSRGNLGQESLIVRRGKNGAVHQNHIVPSHLVDTDGRPSGLARRYCTRDFKLRPMFKEQTRLMRLAKVAECISWIGISVDEAHRIKDSRHPRRFHRYPLVEKGLTRDDCLAWMRLHSYPKPPRSACVFCPFHSDAEWLQLKGDAPAFAAAVEYERGLQRTIANIPKFTGTAFLHRSRIPLDQVQFSIIDNQPSLFGNECDGMCGV